MRFRNTLIALGLFAGLGAFIYFYEYKGEEGREKAERAGKSVLNIERDAIGEIEIVKLGCSTLVLTESLKALIAKRRTPSEDCSDQVRV